MKEWRGGGEGGPIPFPGKAPAFVRRRIKNKCENLPENVFLHTVLGHITNVIVYPNNTAHANFMYIKREFFLENKK